MVQKASPRRPCLPLEAPPHARLSESLPRVPAPIPASQSPSLRPRPSPDSRSLSLIPRPSALPPETPPLSPTSPSPHPSPASQNHYPESPPRPRLPEFLL